MTNFHEKEMRVVEVDRGADAFGIESAALFSLKRGISQQSSSIFFFEDMSDDKLKELPDYILSETLCKDIDTTVLICARQLRETKYFPDTTTLGPMFGAGLGGEIPGVVINHWEDLSITDIHGEFLYTQETLDGFTKSNKDPFAEVLRLIVKDICDNEQMFSVEWYWARILQEYFKVRPSSPISSFLIGNLWKEYCIKETYEGDLEAYYEKLSKAATAQQKGGEATKNKAEELRSYCVDLTASLAVELGPRFMMAPPIVKAREIRKIALENRKGDFERNGKSYSEDWFLNNIIEDKILDIFEAIDAIEVADRQKG